MMNILIITAHPDDEVLGIGDSIKKLTSKKNVSLCFVSKEDTGQHKNKKLFNRICFRFLRFE